MAEEEKSGDTSAHEKNPQLGRIEHLEQGLYSRRSDFAARVRHRLLGRHADIKGEWEHEGEQRHDSVTPVTYKPRQKGKFAAKTFLLLSFAFFLVAAGVSAYLFILKTNTISSDNIDIAILGPTTVDGGDEVSLQITVMNNNTTDLLLTDLLVEYPPGTRSATDITKELPRIRETVGTIRSGESVQKVTRAILFGEEGITQSILVAVDYRVAGSNATLSKEKIYEVRLGSSPAGLTVRTVKKANSGQEIQLDVDVASNASVVTKDVVLIADFPFGFSFVSAVPRPTFGTNVWRIGDLPPESKQKIKIIGTIAGQDGDERVFRFATGIQPDANERTIDTPLMTAVRSLYIERPFIGVKFTIDENVADEHIMSPNRGVHAKIAWVNNLQTVVENAEIEVRIVGDALDKSSVASSDGFYRSIDSTVHWDSQTTSALRSMTPGAQGSVTVVFGTLTKASPVMTALRNPELTLEVTVRGQRISESNVPEKLISTATTRIVINTDAAVTSRLTYKSGPFINTGSLPPQADKETTYTATWTLTNTTNELSGAEVIATLPSYVRFMNVIKPTTESVSFREIGGFVIWDVGTLKAGVGTNSAPREVSFQVAFLPSVSQVGREATLMGPAVLTGKDRSTGVELKFEGNRPLTTRLSTEPGLKPDHAMIVK